MFRISLTSCHLILKETADWLSASGSRWHQEPVLEQSTSSPCPAADTREELTSPSFTTPARRHRRRRRVVAPRPRVCTGPQRSRRRPIVIPRHGRLTPVAPRLRRLHSAVVPIIYKKSLKTESCEFRGSGPLSRRRRRLADRSPPAAAAAAIDLDLHDELDIPELEFVLDLQE